MHCTGDHQWIYRNAVPNEVLSVDHTPFFHGGIDWSEATLSANAERVELDSQLKDQPFEQADFAPGLQGLRAVEPSHIAWAVTRPPNAWGVSDEDRQALARYLHKRIQPTIEALGGGLPS
jgi:hypothetical protein